MDTYIARFMMISEFDEMELKEFHFSESKYSKKNNWYAISMGKLWDKYPNGFYSDKLKGEVKRQRTKQFKERLNEIFWKENIFKKHELLYKNIDKDGNDILDIHGNPEIDKNLMFKLEMNGCDWDIDIVQRCDCLIVYNRINIDRKDVDELKKKARNF